MKLALLITPGLEQTAIQEVQEKLNLKVEQDNNILLVNTENKQQILHSLLHLQSVRRITYLITTFTNPEQADLTTFPWENFITSDLSFRVEVENLKGQENRFAAARTIIQKLTTILK